MKYIPYFYTDSNFPEFQSLSKEDQEALLKDLASYEKMIKDAAIAARTFYIDKWTEKNKGFLHSHTWGKGSNVIDQSKI